MQTAIVTIRQLGTNCWNITRFLGDKRCDRVFTCKYPERRDCKAVQVEIDYQVQHMNDAIVKIKAVAEQRLKNLKT